jgi:hypothetical protein
VNDVADTVPDDELPPEDVLVVLFDDDLELLPQAASATVTATATTANVVPFRDSCIAPPLRAGSVHGGVGPRRSGIGQRPQPDTEDLPHVWAA